MKYRLCPEGTCEQIGNDWFSVIMYIHDHCNELNIDKNKIAISGDSGGGLAVMIAGGYLASKNQSGLIKMIITTQCILLSF